MVFFMESTNKTKINELHHKALDCARRFQSAERELVEVLCQVHKQKVFREKGYSSLYDYAMKCLGLSES